MQRLHLEGRTTPEAAFRLDIAPEGGVRRVTASTNDAGGLLRAFNIMDTMQGGQLSVSGAYDDRSAEHPLSGTAEIREFRIHDAPFLARLLKAITLYGLVDLVQGPGLGFTRLIAPFTLTSNALDLADARAFSASLGLTMKGRVDLAQSQANLEGTIVPAYLFNSLLGHIPFVGKLFSPEQGGGLFAASYTVRGPLADPQVSVNPLSALTPGLLRGVFGD
jgi:AsmA-like C-terminal region